MADYIKHHNVPRGAKHRGEIVVIGLGRFGSSLAASLVEMGFEVLGIDYSEERVQQHSDLLTHVVQADTTTDKALRQLGVADAHTAVVCIGTDIESSVLTVTALVDLGVPNIWAKAITAPHGRILERVGAHHVVFPEAEMGSRVAHLLTGTMLEYIALDDDFVMVETVVPSSIVGKTLGEASLRASHRVTVVAVKPEGGSFTYAERDTLLGARDLIVVAGHRGDVTHFAESLD
ncbi:MAG: TrkA family potassium uptake protein [Ilumatobacteraceae bacterium]|nr:TrkA family potassium uptake protein [Ilumatobacteraceae bacterium]